MALQLSVTDFVPEQSVGETARTLLAEIGSVVRKLLSAIFAILPDGQPYDPDRYLHQQLKASIT